jgi:prepilin-type N-terminal cleavage/methylation domain-containing protein
MSRRRGLTLVELMTVMAVLSLLAAILLPTISVSRESAKRTHCMYNLRTLAQAWNNYAMDNHGAVVNGSPNQWGGWVGSGNTIEAITNGLLYPYCSNGRVYRCPGDHNQYLRSYSISNHINAESFGGIVWKSMSQIRRPEKSLLMLEEWDPRNYNVGSFVVLPTGDKWVDFPARWHYDGTCISFVDGHVEYMKFLDKRTLRINTFYTTTPDNIDLKRLQALVPPNNY